jgi:hypothetical protein
MARFIRAGALVTAILALSATVVLASIPSPEDSTVPDVLTVTPDGTFEFQVIVESTTGPIDGALVEIEFAPATDTLVAWCVGQDHPVISGTADDGVASFFVEGGGCLDQAELPAGFPLVAQVRADGVLLANVSVNSPDIVNDSNGLRATEDGPPRDALGNNCAGGTTEVGTGDAVEHTPAFSLGLTDLCSNFTDPWDDPVALVDIVVATPYLATGVSCTCD